MIREVDVKDGVAFRRAMAEASEAFVAGRPVSARVSLDGARMVVFTDADVLVAGLLAPVESDVAAVGVVTES